MSGRRRSASVAGMSSKCQACGKHFGDDQDSKYGKLYKMPRNCTSEARSAWMAVMGLTEKQYYNVSTTKTPRLCSAHFDDATDFIAAENVATKHSRWPTKVKPTATPKHFLRSPSRQSWQGADAAEQSHMLSMDHYFGDHDNNAANDLNVTGSTSQECNYVDPASTSVSSDCEPDEGFDLPASSSDDDEDAGEPSSTTDSDEVDFADPLYQPSEGSSSQGSLSTCATSPLENYSSVLRKKGINTGKNFTCDESQIVRLLCMHLCSCGSAIDEADVTIEGSGAEMEMKWICTNAMCDKGPGRWSSTKKQSCLNTAISASMTLSPMQYSAWNVLLNL